MSFRARLAKAIPSIAIGLASVALVVLGIAWAMRHGRSADEGDGDKDVESVRLVPGTSNALAVSENFAKTLNVTQVREAVSHQRLNLSGSLFLDSNRMVRVHARFGGEVASIGTAAGDRRAGKAPRTLRVGDAVTQGQLLAVIWCKDVGEKKSDLVDAISQTYLDKVQLDRLKALPKGVVPEKAVHEAERQYESDVIARQRVERTLRSWKLTEEEIEAVRAEAEKIHDGQDRPDKSLEKSWAEVEVRAPFDGVLLEKNITAGDIVDASLDLFKIADLSTLGVMAHVFEEDLPAIQSLGADQCCWTVCLNAQPRAAGIPGVFEVVGSLIDPNQHTGVVMGYLPNPGGKLRAGQFVTAAIDLPAGPGEVVVPERALVDEGSRSTVFVARDATGQQVEQRNVVVLRHGPDQVFIRSQPTAEEQAAGYEPLLPGEWVATAGTVELRGFLIDALASVPSREDPKQ